MIVTLFALDCMTRRAVVRRDEIASIEEHFYSYPDSSKRDLCRITLRNGHKLEVLESLDELQRMVIR